MILIGLDPGLQARDVGRVIAHQGRVAESGLAAVHGAGESAGVDGPQLADGEVARCR